MNLAKYSCYGAKEKFELTLSNEIYKLFFLAVGTSLDSLCIFRLAAIIWSEDFLPNFFIYKLSSFD